MHDPDRPAAESGDDPVGGLDPDEAHEVAQAEARVEAARSRLARLRQAAAADEADDEDDDEDADSQDAAVSQEPERRQTKSVRARLPGLRRPRRPRRSRRLRRSGRKAVAIGAGAALVATSLGAIGYMTQQHHTITHKRRLAQDYAAAARQAVTTLMSIDANHARDDIQRIIDASTGPLKDQISVMSSLMLQQAEESKTITKVNVEAVAVESATEHSAVALVVAKSDVTEADNKKRPPQLWRLSIEIVRDGNQFKMSKVDFLQ